MIDLLEMFKQSTEAAKEFVFAQELAQKEAIKWAKEYAEKHPEESKERIEIARICFEQGFLKGKLDETIDTKKELDHLQREIEVMHELLQRTQKELIDEFRGVGLSDNMYELLQDISKLLAK